MIDVRNILCQLKPNNYVTLLPNGNYTVTSVPAAFNLFYHESLDCKRSDCLKLAGSALTKEMGYNMYIMLSKRYKSQLNSIGSLLGWGPLHGPIIIELAEGWEQLLEVKTEKR